MPFKSEAQRRLCWAKKSRGEEGSWDCAEWEKKTKKKKSLPYKIGEESLLHKIDRAIAEMNGNLGRTGKPLVKPMEHDSNIVARPTKKSRRVPSDSTTRLLHKIDSSLKRVE